MMQEYTLTQTYRKGPALNDWTKAAPITIWEVQHRYSATVRRAHFAMRKRHLIVLDLLTRAAVRQAEQRLIHDGSPLLERLRRKSSAKGAQR